MRRGCRRRRTPPRRPRAPAAGRRPRGSWRPGRGGRRRTAAGRRPSAAHGCRPGSRPARWRRRGRRGRRRPAPRRVPAGRPPRGAGPARCAESTTPSAAPASRTQPHFANENVDALIRRPSTGGTRKPELVRPRRDPCRRPEGERDDRHGRVLDAASSAAAAGRQVGRAVERPGRPGGPARPRRPGRARARWVGADHQLEAAPLGGRACRDRSSRTVASVRAVNRPKRAAPRATRRARRAHRQTQE